MGRVSEDGLLYGTLASIKGIAKKELVRRHKIEKRRAFFLSLLVVLAFFRWIPGGSALDPTMGIRGYLELGLLALATVIALTWWGRRVFKALISGWWLMSPSFWAMLSALWSFMPLLTLAKAGELFLLNLSALLVGGSGLSLGDWLDVMRKVLLVILVLGLGLNVLYYGTPFYFGPPYGDNFALDTFRPRLTLAADHPLVAGHMFALLLLVSAYRLTHLPGILGTAVGIGGLLATQARASTVISLVAVMWVWFVFLGRRYNWTGFIMQLIFLTLSLVGLPWLVRVGVEMAPTYAPDLDTLNSRIPLWIATVEVLFSSPQMLLLGTGLEATRFVTFDLAPWDPGHTHNGYLEILASLGLIGLVLYLPVFVFLFGRLFNPYAGGFALYILGLAFFNPVFNPGFLWFFILVIALLAKGEGNSAHP
jgi:O-antigen ligase